MRSQIPTAAQAENLKGQVVIKISMLALAHIGGIMTEGVAKCPVCGNEPEVRRLIICGTKVVRCVPCVTEMPPEIWNKYAASMEYTKCIVDMEHADSFDEEHVKWLYEETGKTKKAAIKALKM